MSQAPKAVIDVRDLVKVYPGGTRAVDGIDFAVHEGEFFGFLGPNGAGKSTALKILSTLLKKTSGNVTVAGYDVDHQAEQIRRSVGVAMQTAGLDDLAKAHDFPDTYRAASTGCAVQKRGRVPRSCWISSGCRPSRIRRLGRSPAV